MTSNGGLAYPAEYYYPEFSDNRAEFTDNRLEDSVKTSSAKVSITSTVDYGTDLARKTPITPASKSKPVSREQPITYVPLKSPIDRGSDISTKTPVVTPQTVGIKKQPALISSVDNGTGLSTKMPFTTVTTTKKKSVNKDQHSNLAVDVVTHQGLPTTDITEIVKTDPKKNLLRDPAERNIPRLIVDDSVIKQAVRTPRIVTNLDTINENTIYSNQINNANLALTNGHVNGDLTKRTKPKTSSTIKQQRIKHVEDEQPIDDYWKKEVQIGDDGVVTIEPLSYDRESYEGPFGLTRRGTFIFYIGLGIFTLLAGAFLIMSGIFYGSSYPSSSSNTGTLAGIGICALAFYLGLQLILIGLWHQKYRQENPKKIVTKSSKHNDSSARLKTSMEENEPYDYSYQPPMDYMPYADYSNSPYVSNINEQAFYQQPNTATGGGSYEAIVQPSNVQVETQIDPRFLQPMDWSYPQQPTVEPTPASMGYTPATNPLNNNTADEQTEKKHRHRHHHRKTVEAEPPKPVFDSIRPASTVIEAPLPVLSKAPETTELMKSIVEAEKNTKQTSITKKYSNRVGSVDDGAAEAGKHHRHRHAHRRHQHHRRHRHHSRSSCSSCSTCSSCSSRDDFHSDVVHGHYHHKYHNHPHKHLGNGTGYDTKKTKETGTIADLEDVPNVRDNRLEPFPVVRRTIIVEPYPAEPSSQVLVKPQSNMMGKVQSSINVDDALAHSTTAHSTKISKKKKKKVKTIDDLRLEDVNDEHNSTNDSTRFKNKSHSKTTAKKDVKKAFYE